jgi:DNA-binding NtrC family response regulator
MTAPVAILAISDVELRNRIGQTLIDLRWKILTASGGAEALAHLQSGVSTSLIADAWFPDLEIREFLVDVKSNFPNVDLISTDGSFDRNSKARNNRRGEVLHAIRMSQTFDRTSPRIKSSPDPVGSAQESQSFSASAVILDKPVAAEFVEVTQPADSSSPSIELATVAEVPPCKTPATTDSLLLEEFCGTHPILVEVCRRIRLVAPRKSSVLIQGPSGSGKELVARALHRLSPRSSRPFMAVNCAAIPESLLEAELFGYTKGAFTGAIQARIGRLEAANGGTLFLDEIGEMPVALQSKLLRFLEAGELQRIGDNDTLRLDVRIIAASHQDLAAQITKSSFRLDLYYRLAVFHIQTPSLCQHIEDLEDLVQYFLRKLMQDEPAKIFHANALDKMRGHTWPGNVRELAHVIERAFILAGNHREISERNIEFS